MPDRDQKDFNWICLRDGRVHGGKHGGKCPLCGGRLVRDDMLTDGDLEMIADWRKGDNKS